MKTYQALGLIGGILGIILMAFVPYALAQNMTNSSCNVLPCGTSTIISQKPTTTTNTTANFKACIKYKQSVENLSGPNGNFSGTTYDLAHITAEYNLNCKNITGVIPVKLSDFLGGSP